MALIKKMPTKELLEDLLKGQSGKGDGAWFDFEKGEFINPNAKKEGIWH